MSDTVCIYLYGSLHHKNLNAINKYKSINIITDIGQIDKCGVIYSPSNYIDMEKYPDKFFIFGPHFSVFPNEDYSKLLSNHSNRAVYVQPSQWVKDLWTKLMPYKNDIIEVLPFGVDTEMFCEKTSISERTHVFVYYKSRALSELCLLEQFLKQKNITYTVFSYRDEYKEEDYLEYLQKSKYGIVLGRHESQGFAIEEALSCNVPLLVWNAKNMNQELNQNYPSIEATSIPYWDKRCGESFYEYNQLESTFDTFIKNIEGYRPREYVLENISIDQCDKKLTKLISKYRPSENKN